MQHLVTTIRLIVVTMFVCSVAYTAIVWGVANVGSPWTAQGSILTNDSGHVIGSAQIAQAFTQAQYFWPRPSAVDYNATATGGSNLSPANPKLVERLQPLLAAHGAGPDNPLPADLATASGSGMDPHITLEAARFQAPRVARTRGVDEGTLLSWLDTHAEKPGGILASGRIVHVLKTNLALDRGEVH